MTKETEFYTSVMAGIGHNALFKLLHGVAQAYGFTDLFYSRKTVNTDGEPDLLTLRAWDPTWQKIYDAKGYRTLDWVFTAAQRQEGPILFRIPTVELSPIHTEFVADAAKYNRLNGFAMPIKGFDGLVAGFSATGAKTPPEPEAINRVAAAGLLFDQAVKRELSQKASQTIGLTERELDQIHLFGAGRSLAQIAEETGLSPQWIRKSFMRIRSKLQVGTNQEILLKANSIGLI